MDSDVHAVVDDILKHYGVLGMKWGHRSGSSESNGGVSKRQAKKIAKSDKKFEKKVSNPNSQIDMKVKMHNATSDAMNAHLERINSKPQHQKLFNDISAGKTTLYSPAYRKYENEIMTQYIQELNKVADQMGTNASGTKKYHVSSSDEFLGFSVYTTDVKHDNVDSFQVEFIRDSDGKIIGFKIMDPTMMQSSIDSILEKYGDIKVRR